MRHEHAQQLFDAAARGDRDAQDEIIREFVPLVRSRVHALLERDFRRTHGWMLAAFSTGDVLQEVFVDVIRHLDRIEFRSVDKVVGYLATVALHKILGLVAHHTADRRRAGARAEPEQGIDGLQTERELDPALAAGLLEEMTIFREVFRTLGDRQQILIERRLIDQAAFEQIADELGYASATSARMAYYDARARLALKLRGRGVGALQSPG
ncbi:MAG: sigma-70 family RNA polymerase sigma factor [Planctomycetes bacterium]|nr:sigma-70 family RNA polymerase sigma factor [Planctomycetota bacterium]MCB9869244.1 sigma-70 family RNA polymerase sigma factor [Planctomycetota bacterium]MCB9889357.1 sigma-70 family RNA polymerase sigma factor [Planctomycetota bacterium]